MKQSLCVVAVLFGGWILGESESHVTAADWGDLKGRFIFDGEPPQRPVLQINKDTQFCGKHEPRSEKLVVNPEDRGVANVIVWLDTKPGDKVAIHESYAKDAKASIRLANQGCRFDPHISVLRTGQTLRIENPDLVDHNTAAGLDRNTPFNFVTPSGQHAEHSKFDHAEKLPTQIQCSIHPWMIGWLVVKDHPYVAVADEHGRFEMKNLPAGELTFVVWQEEYGYVADVTRAGKPESWKRGRVTIHVTPDGVDLGEVRVPPPK